MMMNPDFIPRVKRLALRGGIFPWQDTYLLPTYDTHLLKLPTPGYKYHH